MTLPDSIMNRMNDAIRHFFKTRPEVVAVYLFGSHARNRARESSDVDLAILLEPGLQVDELELKRDIMVGLSAPLRKDIHPVILNRAGEMLLAQVFKHGKCLYNASPHKLSEFRTVQFSKIADFYYLRKRMEKGFTKTILTDVP